MKKIRHVITGIVICLSFSTLLIDNASATTCNRPTNILQNGSFEDGDYSPTAMPEYWDWSAWKPDPTYVTRTWDDSESFTGNKSVKIYSPSANDARWTQTVSIEPNTPYFFSGRIKTDNVEQTNAGANLSLFGTWNRSPGISGTQDWTQTGLIFNSEDSSEITAAARLGFWSNTTSGSAWFDDLQLAPLVPMEPHPRWNILVLLYTQTDFTVTDSEGIEHRYVAAMTPLEIEQAAERARRFVEEDIPALTSGNMIPELTLRTVEEPLTQLSPYLSRWWPAPGDTAADRDPRFDSVIVIWDPRAIDQTTGQPETLNNAAGLTPDMGTGQTYATLILNAAVYYGYSNVFKHEWGHSILSFFDAIGIAPKPAVSNHAGGPLNYVNCISGEYYVWEEETDTNPIPNSIFNNESGFTHDYYSGTTATADQPQRCLGINPEAWSYGGPVSHSGNLPITAEERLQALRDKINEFIDTGLLNPHRAKVLKIKLRLAERALQHDRDRLALKILHQLKHHIKRLVRKADLPLEEGKPFLEDTNAIITCVKSS